MTGITPPPSSADFGKFVSFVTLLSNPKELAKHVSQFAKAEEGYRRAMGEHEGIMKIAATLEKAEAIKEANEIEATRIKVLNGILDTREKEFDASLERRAKEFGNKVAATTEQIEAKQEGFDRSVNDVNKDLNTRAAALDKREKELLDGQTALETDLTKFNSRKARVDEAYTA